MPGSRKRIKVNTMPTKDAVVSSLTRDATIEACIYDLIDNAIDAARARLFAGRSILFDQYGLPSSYAGSVIELRVDKNGVTVEDNCGGIALSALESGALKFGERSKHKMGIGAFGVGLNRAIFRLGRKANIVTDTGKERAALALDSKVYLNTDDWTLEASTFPSTGQPGTTVEIGSPPTDVARSISDSAWQKKIAADLSARYFAFLEKGLKIVLNGEELKAKYVRIRDGGPYDKLFKSYKTDDGVAVFLTAGQHELHRFSAEQDFDLQTNRKISDDFGWSIICNDRLIVSSDKSPKTGWERQWHPEFNGFVGYVRFVSDVPDLLPWNTTKMDVDPANSVYRDVLDDMREFVRAWRRDAYHAKKAKKNDEILSSPDAAMSASGDGHASVAKPQSTQSSASRAAASHSKQKKTKRKSDHNNFTTVLPGDIDQKFCRDKLLALVNEGQSLDLAATPYAGMAFIRILFETAAVIYLIRRKRYGDLRQACFDAAAKIGKQKTEKEKKDFVPRLEDILWFVANNKDVWGGDKENYLVKSAAAFAAKKPLLNNAVHDPYQTINRQEALAIRDSTLPILRHMIES